MRTWASAHGPGPDPSCEPDGRWVIRSTCVSRAPVRGMSPTRSAGSSAAEPRGVNPAGRHGRPVEPPHVGLVAQPRAPASPRLRGSRRSLEDGHHLALAQRAHGLGGGRGRVEQRRAAPHHRAGRARERRRRPGQRGRASPRASAAQATRPSAPSRPPARAPACSADARAPSSSDARRGRGGSGARSARRRPGARARSRRGRGWRPRAGARSRAPPRGRRDPARGRAAAPRAPRPCAPRADAAWAQFQ